MNHKRKRTTSRAELKRLDNKSYRKREQQILSVPDARTSKSRSLKYWYHPEDLPLNDLPCNGKKRGGKKPRPKKAKLPKCSGHEWYHETVTERWHYYECGNSCCRTSLLRYGCRCWTADVEKVYYEVVREQATCINCWEVRIYNETNPMDWRIRYRRQRRLVLKKRKQDLVSGMTILD